MYTAKRSHSVHAVYSADQDQYSPDRLALMGELRQAIEQGQLVLHYQPKVNLRSNLTEGVEALVRWIHPTRGFIRPDQFIALAEHTGLIGPLSVWILNEALRQCRSWLDDEIPLTVAVNLSTRNLQDEALVDIVSTALRDNEVEPSSLDLEITESAIMQDPIRALENLTLLHDMGVRISIDDFGTGYSSLGYLKRLPVDQIKIDRSFVIDMVSNPEDAYIVRTIADLGHNLDLKVVAEGIENQLTWGLLAAMGCDFAQGYHISKPLPAEELTGWLRSTSYRVLQVVNR
jgi:EAL domain-containing protein (putative c-di-GMP-specific phosphodiesterase class I)